jgi:Na+/melibiose symporter-like transporter
MLVTLNNRAFLILMLSIMILSLATGLVFALNYYISSFFWLLSTKQIGLLTLAGFVTVFFAFLIGPLASHRFGKVKGAILLFCTGYVISCTPLVLGLMGVFLHPGMPNLMWILLAFGAVSGAMTIGASIPVTAMIADVVEDSEIKTGRRNEGLFFAGNSFLAKAVTGLGLLGSGMLLWAAGFPTAAIPGKVDPAVVHHFAFVYLVTITVTYGIGIVVLSYFPITRETHRENLRALSSPTAQTKEP